MNSASKGFIGFLVGWAVVSYLFFGFIAWMVEGFEVTFASTLKYEGVQASTLFCGWIIGILCANILAGDKD